MDSHSALGDETLSELELLGKLVDSCVSEKLAMDNNMAGVHMDNEECKAPPLCQEFQTARLFLSHLGFISLDNLQVNSAEFSLLAFLLGFFQWIFQGFFRDFLGFFHGILRNFEGFLRIL